MKVFSRLVAVVLLGGTAFAAGTLRASSSSLKNLEEYTGMTLYLDHVASAGAWDESLITDAIIVAYNNVHGSDYTLDSGFMEEQIEIPEDEDDESFETNILGGKSKYYYSVSWYNFGYSCRFCGRDDDKRLPPLALRALAEPNLHEKFVDEFCQAIKQSDNPAYHDLKKCNIDFTYGLGGKFLNQRVAEPVEWNPFAPKPAPPEDYNGHFNGEMSLNHVSGTESGSSISTDVTILANSFIEAYNQVHADTPYSITSFDLERILQVPEGDSDEDGGDSDGDGDLILASTLTGGKKYYYNKSWYGGGFGCRFCGKDDDDDRPPRFSVQSYLRNGREDAFEKLYCHLLKTSGLAAYEGLRECVIRFSYHSEATEAAAY